jgi:hypothetical protein
MNGYRKTCLNLVCGPPAATGRWLFATFSKCGRFNVKSDRQKISNRTIVYTGPVASTKIRPNHMYPEISLSVCIWRRYESKRSIAVLSLSLGIMGFLCGCTSPIARPSGEAESSVATSGHVHGGQQPVAGSTIQLYTVGISGDGSPATPLLTSTVLTNSAGEFTITGLYSCSGATLVYITATGGNPGLASGNNPNLALMTALGPCSGLTSGTFISINELTTVAATQALAPYMSSATNIGSGSNDAPDLAAAFILASQFVNTTSGLAPGSSVPTGTTVPVSEIDTLGDIVSTCVNSTGGLAGSGTSCGNLFSLTTPLYGSAPTNTIDALLNIADDPSLNTPALFALTPAQSPFQPVLSSLPSDFSVRLIPVGGSIALTVSPSGLVFPLTAAGFTAQPLTVTITNTGSSTVALNGFSIRGVNASDYSDSVHTCGGPFFTAGSSCTITVSFTPSNTGSRTAALVIYSTAPSSP